MLKSYFSKGVPPGFPLASVVVLLLCFAGNLTGQSTLDSLLAQIERNNQTLRAEGQRVDASAKEFQTGIWLSDPQLSYDFLKGFPSSAGNQNDLIVMQPFDYPTAYKRRRELANLKTGQLTVESKSLRQEILLEAKLNSLQLIFLNKRRAELNRRLAAAQEFLTNYQKKFDARDATALDLNKARHQLLNLQTELNLLNAETGALQVHLTELNGGVPILITDTLYPALAGIPVFETLEQTIESNDPTLQFLQLQKQVGEAQVSLAKALALPKMELGYHYQGILGQQFHGFHLGLSIPLWEHKNRVAQQQLQTVYYAGQIAAHRTEHFFTIKRLYEKYQTLNASLEAYRENLRSLNNMELLNKALQAGQITALEYFVEQSLLYESYDRLLELEREVAKAAAELYKFAL
ncbi:MAG: TolC family protein [Saprospiraceae bacterium]